MPDPKLWSPERPFLYDLQVELKDGRGQPADVVRSYFGMRTIGVEQVGGRTRMVLNGKPLFHMAPLDQGFWPDGIYTAPTDEALRYDLDQHRGHPSIVMWVPFNEGWGQYDQARIADTVKAWDRRVWSTT